MENLVIVLQEAAAAVLQLPDYLLEEIEAALRSAAPRATAFPAASLKGIGLTELPPSPSLLDTSQLVFHHERDIDEALRRARMVCFLLQAPCCAGVNFRPVAVQQSDRILFCRWEGEKWRDLAFKIQSLGYSLLRGK